MAPPCTAFDPQVVSDPVDAAARQRRRRVRLRLAFGASVAAALAVCLVALVVNAAAHYERGRQALEQGQLYTALDELSSARMLVVPYGDAEALIAQTQRAIDADASAAAAARQQQADVGSLIEKAGRRLSAGDADGARDVLLKARADVGDGPLASDPLTTAELTRLVTRLRAAAGDAIAGARWRDAAALAAGLLAVDGADDTALRLARKARDGAALQADLRRARDAAERGRWREALTRARDILKAWPGFPGAAALVARASDALAPPPAPAPPAATTSTPSTTEPASAPQPQPPPP